MKKEYLTPEILKISNFQDDVLTTSDGFVQDLYQEWKPSDLGFKI
jgi:hypothetical protein